MARMQDMTPILEGDFVLADQEARKKRGLASVVTGISHDGREGVDLVTEERMAKKRETYEKCKPVATEVLEEARAALAVRFRFLDAALWRMPLVASFDVYGIASDGCALYFDPVYVIDRFKISFNEVVRDVIHCLFHCIFRHPFMLYSVLRQPWDVACDIAIEAIILDLVGESFPSNMDRRAKDALKVLRAHMGGVITAERLYWFFGNEGNKTDLKSLAPMFYHDSHSLWYGDEPQTGQVQGETAPRSPGEETTRDASRRQSLESIALDDIVSSEVSEEDDRDALNAFDEAGADAADMQTNDGSDETAAMKTAGASDASDGRDSLDASGEGTGKGEQSATDEVDASDHPSPPSKEELAEQWEDVGQRIQVDLESHLAKCGEGAGALIDQLRALNREVGDYAAFLKRFASLHEAMRVNDDEFDYIYYTFGMDRYGNMPLIEPLEYKEDKRIHDFVIAIDTSESCSGEVVQAFMNKTYNMLKETESFHDRVNIHLVQCDASVQEDTKITSLDQLELYLENFELKGFGGTDFRPVFEYVDALIAKGEFSDLRGLIYFTDGEGIFPRKPPAYDTAFVFLDDGYSDPEVPAWALKMLLDVRALDEGLPRKGDALG